MTAAMPGRRRALQPPQLWPIRRKPAARAVPLPERMAVVSTSMTVFSIVALWFVAHTLFLGALEQGRAQDRLYGEFRSQLAAATAPTGGIIRPGAPVALLSIPGLGFEQVVSEGTSSGVLLAGPGHRRDTVLPGQVGVSVIYGRASTFGKPFANLVSSGASKTMTVVTGQGKTTYTLGEVRRAGDPMLPPPAATESRITLVSAEGSGRLGALAPSEVVYIDATSVGTVFTPPGGRLNAISPAETPMASDTSVMPSLALCLGALALVTVGAIYSRDKFGTVRTWVIATPIVLALGWMTSDLTMYLLPNLL
ncbi:MAG: sortase [Aeromicrobium sp.]